MELLGVKLVLLVAVLAAGAVGGAVPLWRRARGGERFLSLGNAFAAGVFLGAGLVHMLPGADRAWQALGVGYPVAFLLAAAAIVGLLLVEHVLAPESAHEMLHAAPGAPFAHEHDAGPARLAPWAVVATLVIHSLLEGLALGAQSELRQALVIFLALVVHKSTAGFALGVSLARSGLPGRRAAVLVAGFAVATPVGILLALVLGGGLEGPGRRAFEATFLALAAGTFVYVATLGILTDELLESGGRLRKWLLAAAGTGLMGVLALWI